MKKKCRIGEINTIPSGIGVHLEKGSPVNPSLQTHMAT